MFEDYLGEWARRSSTFAQYFASRLYFAILSPIIFLVVVGMFFMDSFQHNWQLIEKRFDPNELVVEAPQELTNKVRVTWNPEFCSSIPVYDAGKVLDDQFKEQGANSLNVYYKNEVIGSFAYYNNSKTIGRAFLIKIRNATLPTASLSIDGVDIPNELDKRN